MAIPTTLPRAILLSVMAFILHGLADPHTSGLPVAALLTAVMTTWLAPTPTRLPGALGWGLFAGGLVAGLTLADGLMAWRTLSFALLVSGQALALMGLAGLAGPAASDQVRRRRVLVGLTVLVVSASPVWLAPLLEATGRTAYFDGVVAANPLLHLGTVLGADPLRSDWLYRHSPIGSYAYRYLGTGPTLAATWAVAALSWAAAEYGGRRPPAPLSSTRDPGDTP